VDEANPEAPRRLRRSAAIAGVALFLLVSALLLPWYVTRSSDGVTSGDYAPPVGLFHGGEGVARGDVVLATAGLAILPIPLLFLRIAGRSHAYEPRVWRRDVAIALSLVAAALASLWAWPTEIPLWGAREFAGTQAGVDVRVTANPGLGWWVELGAGLLLVWAWLLSREARPTTEK
jgi:hypothetical protein